MYPDKYKVAELRRENYKADTEENKQLVQDALEWVKTQDSENDYIYNLQLISQQEYLVGRNLGLIASLLPSYHRYLESFKEDKAKKESSTSSYQGSIGERLSLQGHLVLLASWETDFGMTYLYNITDEQGNVFIWKTNKFLKAGTITYKGTVKEHNEYKGIQQTILTRCKISEHLIEEAS